MEPHNWIGYASLVISLITGLFMILGHKRTEKRDYVADLEDEVKNLKKRVKDDEDRIKVLEDQVELLMKEKVILLSKIAGLEIQ